MTAHQLRIVEPSCCTKLATKGWGVADIAECTRVSDEEVPLQ